MTYYNYINDLLSSSSMVTAALPELWRVTPLGNDLGIILRMKFSFSSNKESSIIATSNEILSIPAGIVTLYDASGP